MKDTQQAYGQMVKELERIEQAVASTAPNWEAIPTFKKPLVAIQMAEQARTQIDASLQLLKGIMDNFHTRLTELEDNHGQ